MTMIHTKKLRRFSLVVIHLTSEWVQYFSGTKRNPISSCMFLFFSMEKINVAVQLFEWMPAKQSTNSIESIHSVIVATY